MKRDYSADARVLAVVRHPLGGIRTYIHYNYPTLIAAGYQFTFVAPAGEHFDALREELSCWNGAHFLAAPSREARCNLTPTVRRLLRSRQFCLVHSHGFSAAAATVVANFGIGVPHIFTSHDVIRPDVQFPGLLGNIKRRAFAHALNRIDRIVVVTNDARENHLRWLPALRRRSQKVATIVHGVDIGRFTVNHSNGDARLRDRLGIPRDAFLIGFLGRLMEQKGFHYLAEALDRLLQRGTLTRPVHLLVVGSGDCLANYRDDLSSLPHVSRCLTFMDRVPNVMPVLVELDLLAMPSLWEACGLLAMEGMCAGVPVLGSDCIGLREVLAGTPSPMVPAANVEALAAALEQAIRSPWTEAAGRYAPEARKRFDVAPAAARLQQLFDELADR